jgi:hypothetical protein
MAAIAIAMPRSSVAGADRSAVTQVIVLGLCTMLLFIGGAAAAAYFDDSANQTVVISGNFAAHTQADYGASPAGQKPVAPQRAIPTPIRGS